MAQAILVLLLVCVAVSAIRMLVQQREVKQRLSHLLDVSNRIASGDLSARAALSGNDDLGAVSQTFDRMAEQLHLATAELKAAHDALENRVQERTAELAQQSATLHRTMTEHAQARARMQQYASMLDLTQVLILDLEDQILFWNHGAVELYGWTEDEAIGANAHHLLQTHFPKNREQIFAELLASGSWSGNLNRITKAGRQIIVASHWVLRRGSDGKPEAILEVNDDISEQERLRQQILENERLVVIGTTAAKLAHEIGNPLHGMSLASKLLAEELAKRPLEGRTATLLRILDEETTRLRELLDDFRGLSQRRDLKLVMIDANTLVHEIVGTQQPICDGQKVVLVERLAPDLPQMRGDTSKLKQVLLNLMKNAVEAMPEGGQLTVATRYDQQKIHLDISDTGTGIPEGVKIFEPFITTKPKGTGLGLPVVKQIVTSHGGTLTYSSELGKGTTFFIQLPLSPPESALANDA